jgi:hypothetical protein
MKILAAIKAAFGRFFVARNCCHKVNMEIHAVDQAYFTRSQEQVIKSLRAALGAARKRGTGGV